MRRTAIIGGETHISEITELAGSALTITGATVRTDQREWAESTFDAPVFDTIDRLLDETQPDLVAVANENDRKADAVLAALRAGCDVIVDKPMAISVDEQQEIEERLAADPSRRLLMLLTLRGNGRYRELRNIVRAGELGTPSFVHVRMAVRLKREQRPPWFLDATRSGGLFLDLLIHGLDQVEWLTGERIVAITAVTGNLSDPGDANLRDHATAFCELSGGGTAVVEGQRMLPDTVASDYRITVAGTEGVADLGPGEVLVWSSPEGAGLSPEQLPETVSVVADWLDAPDEERALVPQSASLRANALALLATGAAREGARLESA